MPLLPKLSPPTVTGIAAHSLSTRAMSATRGSCIHLGGGVRTAVFRKDSSSSSSVDGGCGGGALLSAITCRRHKMSTGPAGGETVSGARLRSWPCVVSSSDVSASWYLWGLNADCALRTFRVSSFSAAFGKRLRVGWKCTLAAEMSRLVFDLHQVVWASCIPDRVLLTAALLPPSTAKHKHSLSESSVSLCDSICSNSAFASCFVFLFCFFH